MPTPKTRWILRRFLLLGPILGPLFGGWNPLSAQDLPLKTALPDAVSISCPEFNPPAAPSEEEVAQAAQLGSDADQAIILGDRERARDLLARAVELDPSSGALEYRYARILDDLDDTTEVQARFCRVLSMGVGQEEADYVRERLLAMAAADRPQLAEEARAEFQAGTSDAAAQRLAEAVGAFGAAFAMEPGWAEAVYNRGVLYDRLGAVEAAVSDFRSYLGLRPGAQDALAVSERIGQLQAIGFLPSPNKTLGIGLLMPGLGQFYSGRTLEGALTAALAAGAVGFGVLYKETTALGSDRPFLYHGVAAAVAVTVFGAVESYFWAKGQAERTLSGGLASMDLGSATLTGPSVSVRGTGLALNVLRVSF